MSKLLENSITIYEALINIENGKYIMPAFQRQFVWNIEQIEKLWDSILLDYPIATFLFWHVSEENITEDTYFCRFLSEISFDSRKQADSLNYELTKIQVNRTDTAILDGQQRLTSLFLSLFGKAYTRRKNARRKLGEGLVAKIFIELNENNLDVDENEYNSKKFDIKFTSARLSPTQFEIKNILDDKFKDDRLREEAIEVAITNVPLNSKVYARNILNKLYNKIFVETLVRYTEIKEMEQDDALEMFVRFNSGGKPLKKSDITMSILEAYWPNARSEFGKVLKNSYEKFGTDFIIRSALMLFGNVIKTSINKKIADDLKNSWIDFVQALEDLEELLKELRIDVSRFSGSWNILLPIIYCIFNNKYYKECIIPIRSYILRATFFTYFQSGTTARLHEMKSNINEYNKTFTLDMLDTIPHLRVTDARIEEILNLEKGGRVTGEVLYYLNLPWLGTCNYEQDHLHPSSRFENSRPYNVPKDVWNRWYVLSNRLPNLQYLDGISNASKNDMSLVDYCNNMNDEQKNRFYEHAMIPKDVSLEIHEFENFYNKRKELIAKKIKELLG